MDEPQENQWVKDGRPTRLFWTEAMALLNDPDRFRANIERHLLGGHTQAQVADLLRDKPSQEYLATLMALPDDPQFIALFKAHVLQRLNASEDT